MTNSSEKYDHLDETFASRNDSSGGSANGPLKGAIVVETASELRIEPAPFPTSAIFAINALFFAVSFGLFFILNSSAADDELAELSLLLSIGVLLIPSAAFTSFVYWDWNRERRRGPWLIFEKETQRLRMPRISRRFELHEIVHLQILIAPERYPRGEAWIELDAVTQRIGKRQRWCILKYDPVGDEHALDELMAPFAASTPLKIVRVRRSEYSNQVTVDNFSA